MKYKVGDKVRVRSDLEESETYGCQSFVKQMEKYKGKLVTISEEHQGFCYIEEDKDDNWCWTDEMFEPVEEELTAEEAIKVLADMCARECKNCELGKLVKESRYSFCSAYRREHPDKVVEILKQWKKDHEKKEIEVELAYVVRVIEDTGKVKRCVYEEDVTEVKDEAMKRVLKEYCKEHEGKFFAVYEEMCRVKE
jgi:hypothetical protein